MSTASDAIDARRLPPGSSLLLIVLLVAELAVASDFSLASIALPSIERGLQLPARISQWVITADLLAYAGFLIIAGRLADIYGQRRTLIVGLTTFLAGTILASLSINTPMLIVGRILQGIGGAFTYPSAFSLLTLSFKDGPQRFRAYTINMAASSAGVPLITMLVGWAVTRFGWQSAFLFNVPMCIFALVGLHFLSLPVHERPQARTRIPFFSAILLIMGIAPIVYALTGYAGQKPGMAAPSAVMLPIGLALLATFALVERRSASPLIPVGLLSLPNFKAGILIVAFVVLTGKALIVLSNISLQKGMEFTPFMASLVLLPMVVSSLIVVPVSARLDRLLLPRARWVISGAFAIMAGFYLVLSQASSYWALPILFILLFLSPLLSVTQVNLALGITFRNVAAGSQGVATALTYTMVQIVTATGLAIIITAGGKTGSGLVGFQQFSTSFVIGALVSMVGVLIAAYGLRFGERPRRGIDPRA